MAEQAGHEQAAAGVKLLSRDTLSGAGASRSMHVHLPLLLFLHLPKLTEVNIWVLMGYKDERQLGHSGSSHFTPVDRHGRSMKSSERLDSHRNSTSSSGS